MLMFEVYTLIEEGELEDESYESTSGVTQPILAFQQNPRRFGFQYQIREREPLIDSTPLNSLQVTWDPTYLNDPPPLSLVLQLNINQCPIALFNPP